MSFEPLWMDKLLSQCPLENIPALPPSDFLTGPLSYNLSSFWYMSSLRANPSFLLYRCVPQAPATGRCTQECSVKCTPGMGLVTAQITDLAPDKFPSLLSVWKKLSCHHFCFCGWEEENQKADIGLLTKTESTEGSAKTGKEAIS